MVCSLVLLHKAFYVCSGAIYVFVSFLDKLLMSYIDEKANVFLLFVGNFFLLQKEELNLRHFVLCAMFKKSLGALYAIVD